MTWDLQRKPGRDNGAHGADAESEDEVDSKQERARARRVSRSLLEAELAKFQGRRNPGTSTASTDGMAAAELESHPVSPPGPDRIQSLSADSHDQPHEHAQPLDDARSAIQFKTAVGVNSKALHTNGPPPASAQGTPGQVRTTETALQFSGVAGRATLSKDVTIINDSSQYIGGMPRIEGQDAKVQAFAIEGPERIHRAARARQQGPRDRERKISRANSRQSHCYAGPTN